ncbi:hypothetical protein PR048_009163 [Dryococelus australis]|uniref:Uncharacterized protein n=1 Tax=Dryococelus australis TaxID=614101 RepID=A0ABQ9HZ40_9NEOP|nr:hypothetical protein PR048_009163 [Dryococelus australis]
MRLRKMSGLAIGCCRRVDAWSRWDYQGCIIKDGIWCGHKICSAGISMNTHRQDQIEPLEQQQEAKRSRVGQKIVVPARYKT